jgi:hypothetical protein
MTGILDVGCCANAARGHAAAPPSSVMKSRRRVRISMRPSHWVMQWPRTLSHLGVLRCGIPNRPRSARSQNENPPIPGLCQLRPGADIASCELHIFHRDAGGSYVCSRLTPPRLRRRRRFPERDAASSNRSRGPLAATSRRNAAGGAWRVARLLAAGVSPILPVPPRLKSAQFKQNNFLARLGRVRGETPGRRTTPPPRRRTMECSTRHSAGFISVATRPSRSVLSCHFRVLRKGVSLLVPAPVGSHAAEGLE